MDGVVENHRSRCYTAEALQQNARLLELNPEVYTAWNYRKLAVQHLLGKEQEDAAQRQSIVQEELRVELNTSAGGEGFESKLQILWSLVSSQVVDQLGNVLFGPRVLSSFSVAQAG